MMRTINRRRGQKGFTLIELLIVVAIIGIIAAMLIPNLLDALQKGKQKRTVADARNVGTAMMSWLVDEVQAAAAGSQTTAGPYPWGLPVHNHQAVIDDLTGVVDLPSNDPSPVYIQVIPRVDGWGDGMSYSLAANLLDPLVMGIHSGGRNSTNAADGTLGAVEICNDDPANQDAFHGAFDSRRYDCDIVWADGFFVQFPQGLQSITGGP